MHREMHRDVVLHLLDCRWQLGGIDFIESTFLINFCELTMANPQPNIIDLRFLSRGAGFCSGLVGLNLGYPICRHKMAPPGWSCEFYRGYYIYILDINFKSI